MTMIFYDEDTQYDFINPDGALYVPKAELIKPNLRELTLYAIQKNIPIAGSVDRHFGTDEYKHREGELAKWGGLFPEHCMDKTFGQEKIEETELWYNPGFLDEKPRGGNGIYIPHYLDNRVRKLELVTGIASMLEPVSNFRRYKQGLYFEKQSYDVFTNPAFELFLDLAEVGKAVVYGVATDYCVKAVVLGMQKHGVQCYVVEDAIKGVTHETTQAALEEMRHEGAKFVTTKQVLEGLVK